MSNVKEILSQYITFSGDLIYKERILNTRFTAMEVFSQEGVRFHLFYYVIDLTTSEVFYGSFTYPDNVMIQRILDGLESSISGKNFSKKNI